MRCPVDSRLWAQRWQRCSLGGKSYRWAEKLGWGRMREGGGPVWGTPAFIESKGKSTQPENEHPEGQRDKEMVVFTKNKTRTFERLTEYIGYYKTAPRWERCCQLRSNER